VNVQDILGLDELAKVRAALAKLQRSAIRLTATPADDAKIKRGASKLGGAPDLPPDTPWPTAKLPLPRKHGPITGGLRDELALPADGTIALPFVAQIALADVAKHDKAKLLPRQGLLSFFYDNTGWNECAGTRRTFHAFLHPARVRVLYTPSTKGVVRLAAPPAVPVTHAAAKLAKPVAEPTLPDAESCWFFEGGTISDRRRQLALTGTQRSAYIAARYDARANRKTRMLLGHADYVQPWGLENGYLTSHDHLFPEEPALERSPKLVRDFQAAQLLLQISHDAFGRGGRLFFFIRSADLAAGDFSRVWVNEQ
jgi:uncharacterized protein YwqG